MELVVDSDGAVAPRLTKTLAQQYHRLLIDQVVLMLCAGLIHGDLSEFNILLASDGPVIIDLPQVVDVAGNNHSKRLFTRDDDNLAAYFGQFARIEKAVDDNRVMREIIDARAEAMARFAERARVA